MGIRPPRFWTVSTSGLVVAQLKKIQNNFFNGRKNAMGRRDGKKFGSGAAVLIVLILGPLASFATDAAKPDPISVMQGFFDAEHTGNVDAALAHWSDDGIFTDTRGRKRIGHDDLRKLIQGAINAKIRHEMKAPRVEGERVKWTEAETTDFYVKLGIAPVQTISDALVQMGKIKALVVHFPSAEIARIEQACQKPDAAGLLMFGLSCAEFVRLARIHTESIGSDPRG